MSIADRDARQRALDISDSFIVQAPAGSGKTEILTQRYLALLANCTDPEQVVAITFTNKAAEEMRTRVLNTLRMAREVEQNARPVPTDEPQSISYQLATVVLRRSEALSWNLLEQPSRLRIQTFDSFCALIVRQMPLMSRLGGQLNVVDDAKQHYQLAAFQTLQLLESDEYRDQIYRFLRYFDNQQFSAMSLLSEMLDRRDQWLSLLGALDDEALIDRLREDIRSVIDHHLRDVVGLFDTEVQHELMPLARFAARNLSATDSPVRALADWHIELKGETDELPQWQAIRSLFLTDKGEWRSVKGIKVTNGFPAEKTPGPKAAFCELLQTLSELPPSSLSALATLPSVSDLTSQRDFLVSLSHVLKLALANLRMIFESKGEVDFQEIAQSALHALNSEDGPSDLALKFDYRIQHILVDECQDTNALQIQLIEQLIEGWEQGDGRTLFMVGDPMQSIYRFRKADVRLFLQVRDRGIGTIQLTPLVLQCNFRSQKAIVDFMNHHGPALLSQNEDQVRGAVAYEAAIATRDALPEPDGVYCYSINKSIDYAQREAQHVVQLVQEALQRGHTSIAILGRKRAHFFAIATALRNANIEFEGVNTESLSQQQVVVDLLQLTRALLLPTDRVAWVALLRAPFIGLTLGDLHRVFALDPHSDPMHLLNNASELSSEGLQRLNAVMPVLRRAQELRGRIPLSDWIADTWYALHGHRCISHSSRRAADQFFQLLNAVPSDRPDPVGEVESRIGKLYADSAHAPVKLITMHKAKGLEFDTVILPRLHDVPKPDTAPLLRWDTIPVDTQQCLLIGTASDAYGNVGGAADYLGELETQRSRNEVARLLYVSLTRAKKSLHLLAQADHSNPDFRPPSTSLLAHLWPSAGPLFMSNPISPSLDVVAHMSPVKPFVRRSFDTFTTPLEPAPNALPVGNAFQPASDDLYRHVGTVTHAFLAQFAMQGTFPSPDVVASMRAQIEYRLKNLRCREVARGADLVCDALTRTLSDHTFLSKLKGFRLHPELSITSSVGRVQQHRIDLLAESADGILIVDYKLVAGTAIDIERAKDEHKSQLERYRSLSANLYPDKNTLVALYFPLQSEFAILTSTSPS